MATGGDEVHGDKVEGNKVEVGTITISHNISITGGDRIFLRKVGGGYIFIHRMLMEHFTEMDKKSKNESDLFHVDL